MSQFNVDLTVFPAQYRTIVRYYYFWKCVTFSEILAHSAAIGQVVSFPQEFWHGGKPPYYENSVLYLSINDEITNGISQHSNGFTVTEYGSKTQQLMGSFSDISPLEKYVIYSCADLARGAARLKRQGAIWARAGFDNAVLQEDVADQQLVKISYQGHCAILGKFDAMRFSHALVLSLTDLISLMKEGFPSEKLHVPVVFSG